VRAEPSLKSETLPAATTHPAPEGGVDVVSEPAADATGGQPLAVEHLSVRYGGFEAVSDASFELGPGRVLGLVGESGSGKSSLALAISRLLPPEGQVTGTARIGDVDVIALTGEPLRLARSELVAYIPQDASAALNPVHRAGRQVAEVFRLRHGLDAAAAMQEAVRLLGNVGIRRPEAVARQYPHELSGGMRQRVMIAVAIALRPALLVADEPTTALDVTVQAEIIALVQQLQSELGTTLVWITHDMGVVAEIADDVAVMYGGRIVEHSLAANIFHRPRQPYTKALLSSFSSGRLARPKEPFEAIEGSPPVDHIPPGCPFHPRCPHAFDRCRSEVPELRRVEDDHRVACHLDETR
jgi:oligopeptide/dipeptide ABC transporter ATP-binding protein